MPGLTRYFRPILEWLEGRCAPAAIAPAALVAPPPTGAQSAPLPYLNDAQVAPGVSFPSTQVLDHIFAADYAPKFTAPSPQIVDNLFGSTAGPIQNTLFTFTPPPRPIGLPATPYMSGSEFHSYDFPDFHHVAPATEDAEDLEPSDEELLIGA